MKKWIVLAFITLVLLLPGCSGAGTGTLAGSVSIGPLVPVEQEGVTYEIPCEVYEARKVLVYKSNGSTLVETVDIDCEGNYSIELRPGSYVVDIDRTGIDFSKDLPRTVEITEGETVKLDISIDTGIR